MAILGYEKLAVAASAVGLASVPSEATVAHIQCDTAAVRFRFDGTAPTSSEGTTIAADGSITLITTSTSASLKVAYGSHTSGVAGFQDAI